MLLLLAIVANAAIALAYGIISATIGNGLLRTRQIGRRNPLATATVAIFATCSAGHAIHVEHLLLNRDPFSLPDWHLVVADLLTAAVGLTYVSLRRSFPHLWTAPEIYSDTVRAEAEQQVRDAEVRFRTAFDDAPIGMGLLTPTGEIIEVNAAYEAVVGRTAAELVGTDWASISHADDVAEVLRAGDRLLRGHGDQFVVEHRYIRPDGSEVPVLLSTSLVRHPSGAPRHFISQVVDLSDLHAATAAAATAASRFSALYEASPVGIALVEGDVVVQANQAMRRLVHAEDLAGRSLRALVHDDDVAALQATLEGGDPVDVRLAAAADGHVGQVHAAPLDDRSALRIVQVLDVSDRVAQQARLRELADQDPLTGLLNRRRTTELVQQAIDVGHTSGSTTALLLLDLDGFKVINDSLGHAAGDATITAVGRALRRVVPAEHAVGRIGGDEFAVLMERTTLDRAVDLAGRITSALRHRSVVDADLETPIITASVGIAVLEGGEAVSADDLLARADLAVYDAKDSGRNRVAVYDPRSGRREVIAHRQRWIERLQRATGHLVAYAQPIVALDPAQSLRRVELLVRYRDDDGTVIAPGAFLPIAEQTGLVGDIDRWVLRQAVDLVLAAEAPLQVAVNLSAQTFSDPRLPGYLDALAVDGLPPGSLLVELTETAALAETAAVTANAAALRDRGCMLALDDFGSGFATFGYLQRLDVDVLKIDGGLVRDILHDPTGRMIVQSIIGLARQLGLPVIAEHVESVEVLAALGGMGADMVQGHLFAQPRPVAELLADWPRLSADWPRAAV